jgi:hypothetical protein
MTTFIILLSVSNIALGYGLAIYLGHTRAAGRTATSENSLDVAVETTDELATDVAEVATSPEQEVLDRLESIAEEIHKQPDPAVVDKTPATEAESSTSADTIPEPTNEPETAESEAAAEEKILKGINDFQTQLETQQQQSKLHAVTSSSEE